MTAADRAMRPVKPDAGPPPTDGSAEAPLSVLLLSASMGAGHDGAAREIVDRLRNAGHRAVVRDCLDASPLHSGSALRHGYEFELRHVPGAYDATYRFWYRAPWLRDPLARLITLLARRRVLRWVREIGASAVVSTYPLATLVLGHLRATGQLSIPVVNFITDFGVHPLWVHPGVDLNLAVHAGPAEMAARSSKRPSEACGPAVNAAFAPGPDATTHRSDIRSKLDLDQTDRAVLIVAGSWGVGGVLDTFRAASSGEGIVPVVVCGHDHKLRSRVEREAAALGFRAVILGWTDGMPELMAGCDALVENAGGLTSLEAMRAGLPVVSYRPIAGHGRENTAAMAAAGVSRLAVSAGDLAAILSEVTRPGPSRQELIRRGQAMFRTDPTAHILAAAKATVPAPASSRRPPRVGAAAAAITGLTWRGLTGGDLDAGR